MKSPAGIAPSRVWLHFVESGQFPLNTSAKVQPVVWLSARWAAAADKVEIVAQRLRAVAKHDGTE
jgi:hypothetical protein